MKQLSNYLKVNNAYNNIDESLNNNIRMINESQLVIEHGKDIDSLLQKFGQYTYNSLYNQVNESAFNFKLTLNESITARDFFIFICEDYKEALLEELNIYEQYINDTLEINEGIKNSKIYQNVVGVLKQGKEKTLQAYNDIKTKIKEVNQIIKDFANKTIKSVKEMANRLMDLLEKFNCTIKELFEKVGFKIKDEEIDAIGADLAKNPDTVKGNDIYDFKSETNESFEAYGQQLINEEIEEEEDPKDKEKTVQQAEKKGVKGMLWSAFKQFLIWASVCVVIPGIICAAFPGTFVALLVPLACKLAWNGYKIVKMWKQWQKVRKEWNTYGKAQRWITVIGMIASIIALAFNFNSLVGDGGKILSAFSKTGCDLLGKANLGIQPDALTRGFAAFVKMISEGKFSMDDFGSAFKEITDSFAEHTTLVAEKIVKATAKVGKSGEELLGEFEKGGFKGSLDAWKKVLKPAGMDPSKLSAKGVYDVVFDGHSKSAEAQKLIKWLADNGVKVDVSDGFNKGLNKINSLAGSVWGAKIPGDVIKKAMDEGINLGHNGWFSILGGTIDSSSVVKTVTNIVKAATSMLVTIPSVEYAFQNNGGFQVRLGTEKENFVYEVGKDGVKKEAASDYAKEYEKITNIIKDTNNKYHKQLEKELKEEDSDKKKEIEDNLKKFQKNFENINNEEVIIFYGKKISEKKNESLLSLYDYIIKETEDTEKNDNIETSKKDAEDELKKIEAPLPADSEEGSKDDNKKKESSETEDEDTGEQPILMIAHDYVIDLSKSDKSGPRKEIFTLKNISDNYEFIEIKKGTSKENLSIMLGSILNTQTEILRGYTILNPCDDKDGDNFKTIGDENTEREDFGKLTNGEITDILNKPKNAKKYIFNGSSKSIAQNEDEKKYEEKKKKEYEDKLKNADEETIKTIKEIDPDAIDKDGKIKQDKIKEISDKASSYKLAQYKSKDTEKGGGLWSKLKNFVKGLFGNNKKEGKKYNKLLNHIDPDTNENLNEYNNLDLFLEEMFKSKSLYEYIIERKL